MQQGGDHDDDDLVGGDHEFTEREVVPRGRPREGARRRAEEDLAGIFEQQGDADGGDEDVERGGAPQGAVGQSLDGHAQHGAAEHGDEEDEEAAPDRVLRHELAQVVTDEGADHEHVRMREVDEAQDAVDHRVAERDERIDGPEGQAVQELLEKFRQKAVGELRAES
jgi:hypothetical protein